MSPAPAVEGLVIVDKPTGWTSHDVVARLRRLAGTRKVGHAGTLDPMATGVLVVGLERATRLLTFLIGAHKSYTATMRLGATALTDDAEGDVTATSEQRPTESEIVAILGSFTGDIEQTPPAYSAIKVNGEQTYDCPFTEDDQPNPEDAYAISKWEAELSLRNISRETGLEYVVIRPPLVYGPGVKGNFLRILRLVERGIPLPLASVNNRRSFIAIDNLTELIVKCVLHPEAAGQWSLDRGSTPGGPRRVPVFALPE